MRGEAVWIQGNEIKGDEEETIQVIQYRSRVGLGVRKGRYVER